MPTPPDLRFDILRNGGRIGSHGIGFREDGGTLVVTIAMDITVGFGPISLFRYSHKVRETWRDGVFLALESQTDDNGTRYRVSAARNAEHVVVKSSAAATAVLAPETIPLTHWNMLCLERPLFNPQDGAPMTPEVVGRGEETVVLADGRKVLATRHSLMIKPVLDNWYDSARVWTALRTTGPDGSVLTYRRIG